MNTRGLDTSNFIVFNCHTFFQTVHSCCQLLDAIFKLIQYWNHAIQHVPNDSFNEVWKAVTWFRCRLLWHCSVLHKYAEASEESLQLFCSEVLNTRRSRVQWLSRPARQPYSVKAQTRLFIFISYYFIFISYLNGSFLGVMTDFFFNFFWKRDSRSFYWHK